MVWTIPIIGDFTERLAFQQKQSQLSLRELLQPLDDVFNCKAKRDMIRGAETP
jgi:hypothetical protein